VKKIASTDPGSKSADSVAGNVERLRALFPEAFREGKIDFDVLRQLLGERIDTGDERFGLDWHGKRRARQAALNQSAGTLRPCPDKSANWDVTQNIVIEGDNLEVLKLLQKSYAGKIKLIYIDPPYNTGGDFVYPDDFQDNITNYLELTGQKDGQGRKLSTNPESSGRFHTDWLNMMYPRLSLARSFLCDDGAMFVSIDDHEFHNLRAIGDSVFGVENFAGVFVWEKRTTRENRRAFSVNHEYIVCYAREREAFERARCLLPRSDENEERFSNVDNDPRGPWQSVSMNAQAGPGRRKEQFYTVTTPSGRRIDPPSGRCWVYTQERFEELKADERVWFGEDGDNVPRLKCFRGESGNGVVPHTMWRADEVGTTDTAKKAIKDLFGGIEVFDTPKPVTLLERLLQIGTGPSSNDLVLDFFAGAGPLGEAVFRQNLADGGRRRFIIVQLPEELPRDAPARSLGLETLSDVAISRIRLAAEKTRQDAPTFEGDLGFRVFRLDSSNIRAWDPNPDDLAQSLRDAVISCKADRSNQDIVFELSLKLGIDLSAPIDETKIAGKLVHVVGGGSLLVCLCPEIGSNDAEPLARGIAAWHSELATGGPMPIIFRDSAFADDRVKLNLIAMLSQYGLEHVRSL
jgi:adenine-specific DNA-methyltransferase